MKTGFLKVAHSKFDLCRYAEADSLRARLAKYEEAAAVVMEAAEASGVTLKQHARAAAYRSSGGGGGSGSGSGGGGGIGGGGGGAGMLGAPLLEGGGEWYRDEAAAGRQPRRLGVRPAGAAPPEQQQRRGGNHHDRL